MVIQFRQRERLRERRSRRNAEAFILVVMLGSPLSAYALSDDASASIFSFSGFGTLGVVHSSETDADFTNSTFKPNGAGFTRAWSPDVDSRLGAQVTANVTSQLSAVVQVISEQLYDNTYRPHVEWANTKYQFTPDLSVRVGRTVLSSFMFSDTRNVGYANPWVRPPVEVYSLVPISNSDGVDASYKLRVGDFVQTLVGSLGKNNPGLPPSQGGGTAHARALWLISDTIEYGAATAHITYQNVHLTIPGLNRLFDAFRQFGPQGIALANEYDQDDKLVSFIGVGAMYDPGRWFALGEWGHDDFHSVLGSSTAWYVSGGYRLAKVTPYLTYSKVSVNSNTSDPGLTLSTLPPFLMGPATGLNEALNATLATIAEQRTISVGARWDFVKNVALKVQYDHTRIGAGSIGTLTNIQPGFAPGGTVNLFSVAIDFVL
jgi:opacity protein-like surface antigen